MENKLKLVIALSFSFFLLTSTEAQVVQDVTGKPFISNKYAEVKGDIYFNQDWANGYVKLFDGRIMKGYSLKYDELEDIPLYLQKEQAYSFVDPIAEFGIDDSKLGLLIFKNGFKPIGKLTEKSYYQLIYDGKVKFLKKNIKNIIEDREYNAASVTKKITTSAVYFLIQPDGNIAQVKRDAKSIFSALSRAPEFLNAYIKDNKLDLKKDVDLIKLLSYYSLTIKE